MSELGAADFLNELAEAQSLVTLQNALAQKAVLVFKLAEFPQPIQVHIELFNDKRAILSQKVAELKFDLNQDITIKFNVGTEIYFIKTKLKRHLHQVYIDQNSKVVQLRRRKEPRYQVPKKWNQTAGVHQAGKLYPCQVVDISGSGIRLEVLDGTILFKRDEVIKIQFQVYKRAEIVTEATVRFFFNRMGASSILGLELTSLKDVQKEKVGSIVEDIINYQSTVRF